MRRTSRLLKNAKNATRKSGHSTPELITSISKVSKRSRSCVREYRQQTSRAFHTSHIFNIHNLEPNNHNNPKRPIDLPEKATVNSEHPFHNSTHNAKTPNINSSEINNKVNSSSANAQVAESTASTQTKPQASTSSSNNSSNTISKSSKKYIPDVRKRVRIADFEEKKVSLSVRLKNLSSKVAKGSKEYGVRLGLYIVNIPKHLVWSMCHPIQATDIAKMKLTKAKTVIKDGWHHHVVVPFRLGRVDYREARRIFKQRKDEGRVDFTPLEKRKLQAIAGDFLRLVPYSVFFVVPFMELLLPFYIKLFPEASPSWFESRNDKEQRLRTKVEFRRSMAEFIQGAMTQYEAQLTAKQEMSLEDFKILQRKLQRGKDVDIAELRDYIPLFNLHLNLNKLDNEFLMGMCKMLGIPTPPGIANSEIWLRFLIRNKMKNLRNKDAELRDIGLDKLSNDDLINENVARGGRGSGMTRERLERQLNDWILMNYENNFPETLTLVIRASTANAGMVSEPKEIKIAAERESELKAEKKKQIKEASETKTQKENKLLGQKYSLDIMDLRSHKVSLNDLRAIYRTLEELCDIVNVRDISTNVFSIKNYINDQTTFGASRADRMDNMRKRLDKVALKMDSEKKKIAEKLDKDSETLRGEKVVGHVNQDVAKALMVKYYGKENAEHRVRLSGYVEMGQTNLNEMLITHVIRALNPEEDKSGLNVKMARKALEIELNNITKMDNEVAKAVKAKSPDFNQQVFTEQKYDLYNIAKTLIDWKLEITKRDEIIDE